MRSRNFTTAALASGVIGVIAPAPALATVSPPALTSAFSPATIAVGGTATLSFTITNPNASKLTGVGLSDALPPGLVIDEPNGVSNGCGSSSVLTAATGSGSVTLTGGSLAANANCVVSVNVSSNTPGSYQNNSAGATSTEGGAGTGDLQTLQVFAPPAITVSSPKNNATFGFGQKVKAVFACTEATGGPGINDCEADDADTGAAYASGRPLDTTTPGKHTLTLLAVSLDGGQTTEDLTYTVQPDNRFTVSTPRPGKHGKLAFALKLPGAGAVSIVETEAGAKHTPIAASATTARGAKTLQLVLNPSKAGKALLSALKKGKSLPAQLRISYTPKHGVKNTQTVKGIALRP